jgi:hypothetical protein
MLTTQLDHPVAATRVGALHRRPRRASVDARTSRVVRLGTTDAVPATLLAPAVRAFRSAHPDTPVEVAVTGAVRAGLRDGSLHLGMVQARLGDRSPMPSVEDALAHRWTDEERAAEAKYVDTRADVVGDAETVRAGVEAAVEASGADEVIAITNTPDPEERRASFRRLAEAFALVTA